MPGNEVGDRVHNFFGQENLSQGQYHSQAVDGNWPGLSNNLWAGSQRPTGGPFLSNLKNFNLQQSDSEQHTSALHLRHGLNLAQSNQRPDIGRNQTPNQQTAVNGYMQGHQVFQSRQNEANILGVDTGADLHGISSLSRGVTVLESQQGSGLDHYKKSLNRTDATESPVNYDFFGGQQQISSRQSGMLQSFPRQQSGINDMQLLQQHAMLNQMQELQRQQQFHQLEARQHSMTPASSISKQTVASHSASLINGIPINEASNLMWQPEVMAANTNWLQRGASAVIQGSANGFVLSPEQLRLMGLIPNQGDQSLYGLPISGSRGAPSLYSHVQADKSAMTQVSIQNQYSLVQGDKQSLPSISTSVNAFPAHHYAAMSDQTNLNDATSVSRQDIQGKNMFGSVAPGINSGLNMENLQQMNSAQRDVPMEDFHARQELAGSSETSQDKLVVQAPPHNVATLDPTEEKILFGSDDNPWDGFGRNSGFNMLDGSDGFSGFPSLQSGSWSALMQSAVAETSSSEVGIQEEWSGLSSRNTERSLPNEGPSPIDSSKQQSVWPDNNLQSVPNINSRPVTRQDELSRPNSTVNYSGLPGFHQPGADTAQEQHNRLHADSSQRSIPQISERGKWLDCSPQHKPGAEGSHIYGNAANSSGLEINENIQISEPLNISNGWNYVKSAPPDNNPTPKTRENENVFQPHRDTGQVPTLWEPDSDNNSSVALEHVKSAGNMQVCEEDSGMNGVAAMPNSGATWVSRPSNHQHSNVDTRRNTDSVGSYGRNEGAGKYMHHMEKNPLVLESLQNQMSEGEAYEIENSNKKDKSADGMESNPSYHRASGVRENSSFDGSDLHSPKLPGQGNRRPPVTRKFQYHPMGDVGVETESYENKHVNSQPIPHQPFGGLKGRDQSYPGQSKYGHSDRDYTETEKRRELVFQGDKKSFEDNASKSELSSHVPKTLMPFDRNVGNYASNKTASPSQNILELLHKVDQSREHGFATNTSTSNCHLSSRVMDTESPNGSIVHPQRNQSSSSQGFGLQLAPPTQRLPTASSHATSHVASEMIDKGTWLADAQTIPSRESSHEIRSNIVGSPRIHAQNQNMANLGGQVASTQCDSASHVDRMASTNQIDEYCERAQTSQSAVSSAQDLPMPSGINQIHPGDPAMQISALETGTAPHLSVTFNPSLHGTPSKVLRNVWTNVSCMQQPTALKAPSHPQPNSIFETATRPQKPHVEDSESDANERSGKQMLLEVVDAADGTASASCVKEHVVKSTPDASQSSQAATPRDIEDFGRSLRPNTFLHHNFSTLNQLQSRKNMDINPIDQDVNKFKVSDDVGDRQFDSNHGQRSYGYNYTVEDVLGNNSSVPGNGRETNASSEVVEYGQKNAANSNNVTSLRSDHSIINPQMAPSWFEQYGTFKNGKMLPMHDVRAMTPKIMDQSFIVKNQSASMHLGSSMEQVNTDQHGHARLSPIPTSVVSVNVPSQLLPPAVEPDLHVARPKKRKSATSELMAWHEELKQGSERLRDIRVAELDWAQAANRLIEKVEEDAELVEVLPTMKSRRRLVLTTQLMQQLLNPPPAEVLSADVKLHHDSVIYSVARSVLGDGCSSVSVRGSDSPVPATSKNLLPNKLKSSDKIDQYILKVEDFSDRARKLENDMLRLESRASFLDLRIECHDLERFSVINRFAKFHGRGQNDGAETSQSSAATANAPKSFVQRYVTGYSMPETFPDRVQCLSL
ncbi:uncharacterized protein LOC127073740 isoform X3 [Lathyrus oleraceus]|uniref:uncharacterized protein LOC127073740 isoform X3 n=1 Tax=Pisum sativum TaxID=3888 RepID=UPI0021CF7E86|nr:uncharacterized protein LOC127073740 isoform X3 [Pisum sativum]